MSRVKKITAVLILLPQTCDKCKHKRKSTKKFSIQRFPSILVLRILYNVDICYFRICFLFLITHFSFLASYFSFLTSHFPFLVLGMFTIFSHVKSVIIIYLSFLPLIIRKIACFTVQRSFSCLNSMSKDGMSRDE